MRRQPIEIEGRPIGRLRASWLLFRETFRFFWADPELFWIPIIATVGNLLLVGLLLFGFVLGSLALGADAPDAEDALGAVEYAFIFGAYIFGAFTVALAEAAIVKIVSVRAHGGNASFSEGISTAFKHAGPLFIWAVITSTVGLLLRMIAERSQLIGRLVVAVLGAAWSILTYFAVPSIVLEGTSAPQAIRRSGSIFRVTWGELFVANFGVGLVFVLAHISLIISMLALGTGAAAAGVVGGIIIFIVLYAALAIALVVLQQCFGGILKTLLFLYATESTLPANFNSELLEKMLARGRSAAGA